jgi:heme exporter protein C
MTFSSLSPRSTSRSAGGLCLSLRLLACLCRAGDRALLFCAAGAGVFFVAGLCDALWLSPPDYQQGETVRILYIHAPAAWMGMALYAAMSFAAAATLVLRNALADLFCTAAAPVGLVLTGLCLATGSIWGRPTWGAWWAWDARLTSMLVLFLLYASFLALRRLPFAARTQHDAARAGALLLLAGFADLPVVKY